MGREALLANLWRNATRSVGGWLLVSALGCNAERAPNAAAPAPSSESATSRAQALDASGSIWTATATDMSSVRSGHAAVQVATGSVLVCGGEYAQGVQVRSVSSCDLYSQSTNQFTAAPDMTLARSQFTLTRIGSTSVVCAVGGLDQLARQVLDDVRCIDLSGSAGWQAQTNKLKTARSGHTADWLPTQARLLVLGGSAQVGTPPTSDELTSYSAGAIGTWQTFTGVNRTAHTTTLIGDKLLIAGGQGASFGVTASVRELSLGSTNNVSFRDLKPIDPRSGHVAALVDTPIGQRLLIAGGFLGTAEGDLNPQVTDSVLLYDPAGASFPTDAAPMSKPRQQFAAAKLGRWLIVSGGIAPDSASVNQISKTVEVYDPLRDVWYPLDDMGLPRSGHLMTPLDDRSVLVNGGSTSIVKNGQAQSMVTASAEVLSPRFPGDACDDQLHQCISGFCADGVCCDAPCTDSCQRCNTPGKLGQCLANVSGAPSTSDYPKHPECSGASAGYLCAAGACGTSCSSSDDCTDDYHCVKGACLPRAKLGSTCDTKRDCVDDHACVDGVCCNSDCAELCTECDARGQCVPHQGPPIHGQCPGSTEPPCGYTCDGATLDRCVYPGAETACGQDVCANDAQVSRISTCADGACMQPALKRCAGFTCNADGTECGNGCDANGGCQQHYICNPNQDNGICVLNEPLPPCDSDDSCPEGLKCWEGTCCSDLCPSDDWSCSLPNALGLCRLKQGGACTEDQAASCGTGLCVDGHCCESACNGPCESCDNDEGRCTPLAPDTTRDDRVCDDEAVMNCRTPVCDGVKGDVCGKCQGASCDDDELIPESGPRVDCSPYTCAQSACLSQCANSNDCAEGFVCDHHTSQCVAGDTRLAKLGMRCAIPGAGGRVSAWWALPEFLALAWFARRRQRRSSSATHSSTRSSS